MVGRKWRVHVKIPGSKAWTLSAGRAGVVPCVLAGAAGLVLCVLGLAILLSPLSGCSAWGLDERSERQAAVAAQAVKRAEAAKADAAAIAEAERAAGVGRFEPVTGEAIPVDQEKLAEELAKRVSAQVLAELVAKTAAGEDLELAAKNARIAAARRAAQALTDAAEAREAIEAINVEKRVQVAKDDRAWGLAELGLTIAGSLGVPGVALVGAYFGRLRGLTQGATQAAQVVGTARALDPAINEAFKSSDMAPLLRQALQRVDPRVRAAIDANKTTPLPSETAAVAHVVTENARAMTADPGEFYALAQRVRELEAELQVKKSSPSGAAAAA